ncbi:hypothetical protein D3C81_1767280 [compost metagenome]
MAVMSPSPSRNIRFTRPTRVPTMPKAGAKLAITRNSCASACSRARRREMRHCSNSMMSSSGVLSTTSCTPVRRNGLRTCCSASSTWRRLPDIHSREMLTSSSISSRVYNFSLRITVANSPNTRSTSPSG